MKRPSLIAQQTKPVEVAFTIRPGESDFTGTELLAVSYPHLTYFSKVNELEILKQSMCKYMQLESDCLELKAVQSKKMFSLVVHVSPVYGSHLEICNLDAAVTHNCIGLQILRLTL